ncbi:MAG: hypothetical protein ACKVKR_02355, partial [Pseudomonadales bacterium]
MWYRTNAGMDSGIQFGCFRWQLHLHPDVVARYQYFGTKILTTPDTENIRFHLTSNNGVEEPYLSPESH